MKSFSSPKPTLLQANLHHQAGDFIRAEALFREILRAQPNDPAALTGLARTLQHQDQPEEATAMFRRVVALQPDLALAHLNLGVVLCESGKLEESVASFRRHAELTYKTENQNGLPPYKIQHDEEQLAYLKEQGIRGGADMFHIEEGSRVAGPAVNPDVSSGDISARWQNANLQIAVIDDFLTPDALDKLQRFCRGSTIWRKIYEAGYLGAMPEHGIGSPLLVQIAEELREAYPAIFDAHPLRHFWGFKYDSNLSGVVVHADFAAVNVNFWITPDEANLDPETGGLIIWDKPAPMDWDFSKYNDDVASARDFLARTGAKPTTIPYRCNRAVIFDADLFHETDRIAFKEGYPNRRINITLLYGRRETGSGL